jgi:guanine deaminase
MNKAIRDQFNEYLLRTLELAELAKGLGDGPFGAVILDERGNPISEASNSTTTDNSIVNHAEINAIQLAEYRRGKGKLKGCTIVSSAEPCPMCTSAILWSGLSRIVYGASIQALEQKGVGQIRIGCRDIVNQSGMQVQVYGPLMEEEAMKVFGG